MIQSEAPYLDALRAYADRQPGRFHIPGHKGGPGADPGLREAIGDAALALDIPALIEILTAPKNALVRQYQRLFQMEDVELTFHEDALKAIAEKAIERKTGARGLRSILEGILLDTMYDLPSLEGVEEVVISEEVVKGKDVRPLYIYFDRKKDDAPASA